MYNLLNATFFRLRKNKIFWITIAITLVIAIFLFSNKINTNNAGTTKGIDQLLLDYLNVIGIILSIFTSFFIGSEYSNGAIRKKLSVGNSRMKIYFSNLIISIITGIIIELVYLVFIAIIGIPNLGGLQMPLSQFLVILLSIVMIIVTYSCIFTFISLLCTDITIATVINLISVLIMFVGGGALSLTANSEEFLKNTIANEKGEVIEVQEPNPNYPGKEKKKLAQTVLYLIPAGQANQIINYSNNTDFKLLLLYSLGVSIVITTMGIYAFSKEDLK